jgi:hypothetical protein
MLTAVTVLCIGSPEPFPRAWLRLCILWPLSPNPPPPTPGVVGLSSWDTGHWGSLARSSVLLCQHRLRGLVSKDWAPRSKRSQLIYPCKQAIEAKNKAQPTCGCMWLHWLFYFPNAMWHSCFNSLSFISLLCHPLPHLIRTQPVCFSSGPPPCYISPCFDAWTD